MLIDGIDARDWPLATLRSQVCIVAQDTFLFSDTIGSNISFGAGDRGNRLEYNGYDGQRRRRGYDEQYVRRMAAIAGADGFISSMPDGYDTVVGERGVGLSGGQKQRLSLARALADNPSMPRVMDDTTSAVDMAETEAEIQRHLARSGRARVTIVTIAHRISSVKDSDLDPRAWSMGAFVERGTHDELVAAPRPILGDLLAGSWAWRRAARRDSKRQTRESEKEGTKSAAERNTFRDDEELEETVTQPARHSRASASTCKAVHGPRGTGSSPSWRHDGLHQRSWCRI